MDVFPSHPNLSRTDAGMTAASTGELRALLKPIESKYDFVIYRHASFGKLP
jgi:cellulose biosynthesis protein BcsQ